MLLSKRTAGVRPDADDEGNGELRGLPDVSAAPQDDGDGLDSAVESRRLH